jgi:hypothetical protein
MNSSIRKYEDIDVKDMIYNSPVKIGSSYYASIGYGENCEPLYIQTPKIKSLHNLEHIKGKSNPYLEVEIPNGKYDIYDFFLNMDDQNMKTTFKNSKSWFKKELPLEAIDDMYKRTVQPVKKHQNPKLKFRLPVIKNKIVCNVYNQQRVYVDLEDIKEDSDIILILHIRGLKILKQYFYCDCYISQIKVFQPENVKFNIMNNYSILDDKDDDDDIYNDIFAEEIIRSSEDYIKNEKQLKLEQEKQLKLEQEKQLKLEQEEQLKLEQEEQLKLEQEEQLKLEQEKQLKLEQEKQLKLEQEKETKIKQIQADIEQKQKELDLISSQ